jgi:dihydropteroate synthase
MTRKVYLRPAGLVPADRTIGPSGYSGLLPLCGNGPFDFTALEIIRRDGRDLTRKLVALGEVWESGTRADYLDADDVLDRLTRPRRRLCGLDMTATHIMGVVNVTPDSFSDGGQLADADAAIAHGLRLADEGAAILDIGGESTRPGSEPIPADEELRRVMPVIEALVGRTDAVISIDTRKARVMREAAAAGARLVNDVSALSHDPDALETVADLGLPVVLMHTLGDPKTMQENPRYDDVLTDVYAYLDARIAAAETAGIPRSRLVVDPGIGFGKTLRHNLELMAGLALFHGLGVPILLGASRKRWIGTLTDEPVAAGRVIGSVAAAIAGAGLGAQIVRVHDVRATLQALAVATAARIGREPLVDGPKVAS